MTTPSHSSPWEPPTPEELHAMLPQYEISAILGRGGMGAVYKGRQKKLNRDVAIKLLPETLAEGEDELNFAARFEQEAQAMANLDHPAIVSVYDFGETEAGQCYFVMEFIDGMDIHQYLQANGGQLSQEHALAIASHVLDALEYAHSRGIVHRDIKPANVLLNQEGRVKIADFGLAKKIKDEDDDSPGLTMSNVALGTPDFVAPESLDGSCIPDHRADLYAVGVMLYQMLTGSLPRGQFKTPSELRPEVDLRLDAIVSRAMQTDPADRYGSATEIRSDLDVVANYPVTKVEVIEEEEKAPAAVPKKSVPPAKKSNAGLWAGIGIGVAVVVVGSAVFLTHESDDPNPEEPVAVAAVAAVEEKEKPVEKEPEAPAEPAPKPESVAPEPEPVATAVVEPPAPAPEPKPVVETPEKKPAEKPPVVEKAEPDPLLPELAARLSGYLKARQTQIESLATKYERALVAQQETAADGGNLPLVKAFRGEAAEVATLRKALAAGEGDLTTQVSSSATLPTLPDGSPAGLVKLRETWTTERAKIQATLDRQLAQSLQALESQLTQAREFDKAETVLAFKNNFGTPPPAGPETVPEPQPEPVVATADTPAENPFGWKPIPDNPFPIPIPERQTTPCRVVAFRIDGKPIDEAAFRETYGGVPADMGEVVDFEAFPSVNPESESKFFTFNPVALRADGSCTAMRWKNEMKAAKDELTDVVAMDMGRFAFIALREDGTVVAVPMHPNSMKSENLDFDDAADWKDIVRVSAGDFSVGGVTTNGEPRFAGDNRLGQSEVPDDLRSDIIDIDVTSSSGNSALVQKKGDRYRFANIGRNKSEFDFEEDERYFLSHVPLFADSRGRPTRDYMEAYSAHSLDKLGRNNLRDVIFLVRAWESTHPSSHGIAVVCEENDHWTFWGNTDEIGGFDPDYCAERAEGAWKVFPMYPYVLALKPVSKLTPEDWTGATSAEATTTKPEAPAPPKKEEVSEGKAKFPLPIPSRPTVPGHVVVLRRDGKPLDPATEHPVAVLPGELDRDVVQIAVSGGTGDADDAIFAAALFDDGKVRLWGGESGHPDLTEDLADKRKMRVSDIVQVSAGSWSFLFLDDKGRLHGTGGSIGINWNKGIEKISVPRTAVDIHSRSGDRAALLETGEIVIIATEKSSYEGILEKIPRSIAMATVYGGVSLGEDLVWRSWLKKTPGEVTAEFPSEGLIGKPSALNSQLMWIGADGKVRANFIDTGVKPDNFSTLPKNLSAIENATAVHIGPALKAVGNDSGEWFFNDDLNDFEDGLSTQVKGAIAIESTLDYIFALMPGERKE